MGVTQEIKIAVVGLWHLGTVTAGCLASAGYEVIGYDANAETVAGLNRGDLPVAELGLAVLIQGGIKDGKLSFSDELGALSEVEVIWITYDTPVDEDDQADVEFVVEQVKATFPYLRDDALVFISSQLPVGSTRRLEEAYRSYQPEGKVTFAYLPENLRLGKAIEIFTKPDRVVAGTRDSASRERIAALLKPFTDHIEWMSVESAEMTKHALNAFLATSVAFINELANVCEKVGADARDVARGLKSDIRIGPRAYLNPGAAFAGGTLARDISFLVEIGQQERVTTQLFSSVKASNSEHKSWARHRLVEMLGQLRGTKIAILGLTYKPGTDTLRRSSAIELCRWLKQQGAVVTAYDPAVSSLPSDLTETIELQPSIELALRGAMATVVATEWDEFRSLRADELVTWMARALVLDAGRFLENGIGWDRRIQYLAVGRGQEQEAH